MDSGSLRDAFRTEVFDLPQDVSADADNSDLLWSDAEIYGYIDDAQKMFCRLVGGIGDGSSTLTQLSVAPANGAPASDWISISPLILKFRDAWDSVLARPIAIVNYEDLPSHGIRFNGRMGSRVEALVIGIEPGRARVYPAPNLQSQGFIQLVVDRLPLKAIDDDGQRLEIGEMHHIHLLLWMKHRAYGKQDADTFDAKKANDFKAEFEAYCVMAKQEKERAKSKVRIVQYGGIGGAGRWGPRSGFGRYGCHW